MYQLPYFHPAYYLMWGVQFFEISFKVLFGRYWPKKRKGKKEKNEGRRKKEKKEKELIEMLGSPVIS